MAMSYKAPEFIITRPRAYAIPFNSAVNTGANLTIVGGVIPFKYRITRVQAVFRSDAANLVRYYVLTSRNSGVSTTGPPPDTNAFSPWMPNAYLIGEGLILDIPCDFKPDPEEVYIKVHCTNGCAYVQTMNVIVHIEESEV